MNGPTYKPPPPYVVKQLEQSKRHVETSLKEGATALFVEEDNYESLDLAGAVLSGGMLHRANLSHSRLDDAWLDGVYGGGLRLIGASMARTKLVKADMVAANLSGAVGPEANFTKARLTEARFDGSNFHGAQFFKAMCWKGSFRNANLEEANLRRAVLDEADFSGALLDAADLTQGSVEGANFTGAFFTGATRLQGCHHLERAIADRIFFNKLPLEGDAAREVLKSLTSPNVYDLLEPNERQLRLMLDCLKAARRSETTLREASDSLLSLCSGFGVTDRSWKEDVASHAATLGSASLAARMPGWTTWTRAGRASSRQRSTRSRRLSGRRRGDEASIQATSGRWPRMDPARGLVSSPGRMTTVPQQRSAAGLPKSPCWYYWQSPGLRTCICRGEVGEHPTPRA